MEHWVGNSIRQAVCALQLLRVNFLQSTEQLLRIYKLARNAKPAIGLTHTGLQGSLTLVMHSSVMMESENHTFAHGVLTYVYLLQSHVSSG